MTNVMEDMEDYVEYNDTIEPANDNGFLVGMMVCFILVAAFLAGAFYISINTKLPTILLHVTHDEQITSVYVDGRVVAQEPNSILGNEWTIQKWYDLNQEKND